MIQGSDTMRRDAQMANQQAFEFKQQVESLERISAEARRKVLNTKILLYFVVFSYLFIFLDGGFDRRFGERERKSEAYG